MTRARQGRRARQGLPACWGHQGPADFLERWGAPAPLVPLAQQATRAFLQTAHKVPSTPCSHLRTRTLEMSTWPLLLWTQCWQVSQGPEAPLALQVLPDHMVPQDLQVYLDPRAWLESGA